jgi:hypothetical protein
LERASVKPNPKSPPIEQRITPSQQDQDPEPKSNIYQLKLVGGRSSDSERLHHMRDGCVVLYKRSQSTVWQVRFKLFDLKWHSFTTKHKDLEYARRVASTLYDRARFAEEMGLPLQTKTFGVVAQACVKQMDLEIEQGLKVRTCLDYQRVIKKYLIPFFGKYNLTNIDIATVRKFELWRNEQMGSVPKASTLMTHLYSLRHTYATMAAEQLASKTCCFDTISVISITIALFKEKRNQLCKHLPLAIHIGPVRGDKR